MAAGSDRAGPVLASLAAWVALVALLPAFALGGDAAPAPPEPELEIPVAVSEVELEGLPAGDPRRPELLVQLALRRHADAVETAREERLAHELALGQWREANEPLAPAARRPPPPRATPRSDALRAQAVRFAERAVEEAPRDPRLAPALLVGGLDADAIGRGRDALRMLGMLIRRFPEDRRVADAWLALGEHHLRGGDLTREHHLRGGDLTRARVAFDQAERGGAPPVRAWASARLAEMTERATADSARPGGVGAATASAKRGAGRARR